MLSVASNHQRQRRMGNEEGWEGPLSEDFIDKRHQLQLKILERMRLLGMMPVLPAFAGYVPQAMEPLYPNASFIEGERWNGFGPTLLLQPSDPLFAQIAEMIIEEQYTSYGWLSHYYNADTFNEMLPSSRDPTYLSEAALYVLQGIKSYDPSGKWIMQGWMFTNHWWSLSSIEAYLSKLPREDVLVLDLNSDAEPVFSRTNDYFHTSYVWCLLHNFGGRPGVYGNLGAITTQSSKALDRPDSTMVGMGITMEATQQNPIVYDIMLDAAWQGTNVGDGSWVDEWVSSRYGSSAELQKAWSIISSALYNGEVNPPTDKWIIYSSPSLSNLQCLCSYCHKESQVHVAWSMFLGANQTGSALWRRDLTVFTALVLQTAACRQLKVIETDLWNYWQAQVGQDVAKQQLVASLQGLIDIYDILDDVLATDINLQLACWLEDAGSWGNDANATALLRAGARNQITLWGPDPDDLNDYAKKSWSGLVRYYYRERWIIVRDIVAASKDSRGINDYTAAIRDFELAWNSRPYNMSTCKAGERSIYELAQEVRRDYYPELAQ
eukprot:TRINITY_DN8097_c0_g1_i2.p2 TRINITY_DN8097_c0_g1~~TRINITY_DN8097_c0_g1_i2.p2  ORF type:complete len:551 (+),score=130.84 TRINITY_DN8097_c0_g1_i2:2353-4005(+)